MKYIRPDMLDMDMLYWAMDV